MVACQGTLSRAQSAALTMPLAQRRRFDQPAWTAVAIENPCAIHVECSHNLVVMLAKQCKCSAHGVRLQGLRLVTIPNGMRLRLLELKATLGAAHLPDEWLFMKGVIRSSEGNHRLNVDGTVFRISPHPFPIRPLTVRQYHTLLACGGRMLRAQLVSMFEQSLPASVVAHRPWSRLSAGHSQGAFRRGGHAA
jgi:hypothetical protein